MKKHSTPMVSVIVINWDRATELHRCLASVLTYTRYAPLEIVVVDNGSTDGSADMVRAEFPTVKLIANPQNPGAGAARNQGVGLAEGELIALLDCDTYVTDDVIGRTADELLERREIAMIGCELRFPDGRRQHSAQRAMSIRLSLLQNLWLYKLLPRNRRDEMLLGGYWEEDRDVEPDWLAGAFIVVRRSVFVQSGGFDPRLFPEDSEWGIRLTRAGHRLLYAPRLGFAYHTGSGGEMSTHEAKLRLYHRAGLDAYRVLNGRVLAAAFRLVQLLGSVVRWGVYRIATAITSSNYFSEQAAVQRTLVGIYLRPYEETDGRAVRGT